MEMEQVLELIKTISDSPLTEFEYNANGVKIALKKEQTVQVVNPVSAEYVSANEPVNVAVQSALQGNVVSNAGTVTTEGNLVKSPLVGTFYAAPAEDAEAFVKVGDMVREGQVLAIVEAMKLMNDIESEYSGQVAEIFVANGEPVEYGQPLFRIV